MFSDPEIEAMYRDLAGRAELAGIRTTNIALTKIFEESQIRVPKGDTAQHEERAARASTDPYPAAQLDERGHVTLASVEHPTGSVMYEGPYAAAQEAGVTEYQSKKGKGVVWIPEQYTEDGTGPHYLEDSLKLVAAGLDEEVAVQGRIAFGELPGVSVSKSSMQTLGRQEEMMALPTGAALQELNLEQSHISTASESSFILPSAPPITQ